MKSVAIKNKNFKPKGFKKIRKLKKNFKQSNFNQDRRGAVFLSNLPYGFYERALHGYLQQFGNITKIKVAKSPKNATPMGYAYVEFENEKVALIVARTMNNYLMFKKLLKCEFIKNDDLNNKMWEKINITPELCPGTIGKRRNQHILEEGASEKYKLKKEKKIEKIKHYLKHTIGIDMEEDNGLSSEKVNMEINKCDSEISIKTQSINKKIPNSKSNKLVTVHSDVPKSPNAIKKTIKRKSKTVILDVQKSPNMTISNRKLKIAVPITSNVRKSTATTKKITNNKSTKFVPDSSDVKMSPVVIKKTTKTRPTSRRALPVIIDADTIAVQKSPLKQNSPLFRKAEAKRAPKEKKMKLEASLQNEKAKPIKSLRNTRSNQSSNKSPLKDDARINKSLQSPRSNQSSHKSPLQGDTRINKSLQGTRSNQASNKHNSIKQQKLTSKKEKISTPQNSKVKNKLSPIPKATKSSPIPKATKSSPSQMLQAKKSRRGSLGNSLKVSTRSPKQNKTLFKKK